MTNRLWYTQAVVLSPLLMTCGCGGSNSGVASTPAPPVAATPSYDSFVGLNKNVTVQTTSTAIKYQLDTHNGVLTSSISRDAKGGFGEGGISISYDAASKNYTVGDGTSGSSYAPADKITPALSASATPFDTFSKFTSTGAQDGIRNTLMLYRAGAANTQFPQLSYATFAIVTTDNQHVTSGISQATIDTRVVYAIGGFETVRSDLPKTGTASYTSYVTGTSVGGTAGQAFWRDTPVSGTAKITADFGNGSLSTALSLTANAQSIGDFSGTAPIESATSHFKGDLTANGATQGTFSGSFFGPQAAEVGYTFRVQSSIGTVDGGAVGAK